MAAKSMALGGGGRFQKLEKSLGKKGAESPGALAAWIGRKKYGKSKFQKMASKMPAGGSLTPKGDIGEMRQKESESVGGFKAGAIVRASSALPVKPHKAAKGD